MAASVPESLKVIQPFLKLAKEYENRDPVVAYWSNVLTLTYVDVDIDFAYVMFLN